MKTKIEEYIEKIQVSDDLIVDKKNFEKVNNLNNPYRMRRFKITKWALIPAKISIILMVLFTYLENKELLLDSIIIFLASIFASCIAFNINKTLDFFKEEWISKEYEKYTGLKYKKIDLGGMSLNSVDNLDILVDMTNLSERLVGKNENKQRKLLRRAQKIEGL